MTAGGRHPTDRRIERTRGSLRRALGELIREKPYDAIAVSEILERANVGRSTFYVHFADKDALLHSALDQVLAAVSVARHAQGLLGFSASFFEHIHQLRRAGAAHMLPPSHAVVHEHLRRILAQKILKLLEADKTRSGKTVPAALLSRYVASTFILVLDDWIERRSSLPPERIDQIFRALVQPTLSSLGVG